MTFWFFSALGLQGALMAVDEFYFHYRREVPRWERIGHPVDTLCFIFAMLLVYLRGSDAISITAAVFSTLIIVKDEWVHTKYCVAGENYLHALLFILHPVILFLAHQTAGHWGLEVLIVLCLYLTYQTVYWNLYAKRPRTN